MSNTTKVVLVAVVIIAILGFGYWYSTSNSGQPSNSPLQTSTSTTGSTGLSSNDASISDTFLSLLLNMRTIKLDQTIFSDPGFLALQDFSTTIAPDTDPGRVNPFAPIGTDAPDALVTVTTATPSAVTASSALLGGAVSTGAVSQKSYFEYGLTSTTPLPNTTAPVSVDPSTNSFSFGLTGLTPKTTYYTRAVSIINGTPIYGSVQTFKTLAQ